MFADYRYRHVRNFRRERQRALVIGGIEHGQPDAQVHDREIVRLRSVWSPSTHLTLKADYVDVRIDNEVNSYGLDTIPRNADCLFGHTTGGTAVDSNLQNCKFFESLVVRNVAAEWDRTSSLRPLQA
jgi:hypothetical protein